MGRSISGGGDSGVVAEVATSFPTRCLGAIRTWRKLWKIRDEKDEEKFSLRDLENFEREVASLNQPSMAFIGPACAYNFAS